MAEDAAEILLVEDSPDDVAFFIHTFKKAGLAARLQVAGDGAEALDFIFSRGSFAGRNPPAHLKVIVLDLKLPKLDGLDVLRRLKTDLRTQCIPVVVLSSSQEERDLVKSYQLGVNSYVVKPMDFDQFSESIRRLGQYWLQCNETPRP